MHSTGTHTHAERRKNNLARTLSLLEVEAAPMSTMCRSNDANTYLTQLNANGLMPALIFRFAGKILAAPWGGLQDRDGA
jgi:hypothetical protein